MEEFTYNTKDEFLTKMKELLDSGVSKKDISIIIPYPVRELDELLEPSPSKLKYFTFGGAITGFITGFAFTIYTVLSWPLITGGKPTISIPAFIIIAFALTILFGALASFIGFLVLSNLPDLKKIVAPDDYDQEFVIVVNRKEPS
jgi:hypothetical protein